MSSCHLCYHLTLINYCFRVIFMANYQQRQAHFGGDRQVPTGDRHIQLSSSPVPYSKSGSTQQQTYLKGNTYLRIAINTTIQLEGIPQLNGGSNELRGYRGWFVFRFKRSPSCMKPLPTMVAVTEIEGGHTSNSLGGNMTT